MGSEPREPRRPGRARGGARPGAGRSGAGGAKLGPPGGCVSGDGRLATIALFSNPGPSCHLTVASLLSGIFLTLFIIRARGLPSGAMSEGVDLIDIYADEEFNQVRGQREPWDFPGSAGESLPGYLRWFPTVPPALEDWPGHASSGLKLFP